MKNSIMELSTDGLREIGRGATSRVYQLDEDKIIKVYHAGMKPEEIERERSVSRRAFIKGVPTAITYHMARVGDSYGVIYELIDADTLAETIRREPGRLEEFAVKTAEVLQQLHHTEYERGELPDARDTWWKLFQMGLGSSLNETDTGKIHDMIYGIPEKHTFIHGDFHAFNIMVRKGELLLIDVGDSSLGDPVFDMASIYMAYRILPTNSMSEHAKDLLLTKEQWEQFWILFFDAYIQGENKAKKEEMENTIEKFAMLRLAMTRMMIPGVPEAEKFKSLQPVLERLLH